MDKDIAGAHEAIIRFKFRDTWATLTCRPGNVNYMLQNLEHDGVMAVTVRYKFIKAGGK